MGSKNYQGAQEILKQHDLDDPVVRILLLKCYEQLENYPAIIEDFSNPQNNAECISLINASIENTNSDEGKRILSIDIIANSTDPSVIHIRDQLKGKLK